MSTTMMEMIEAKRSRKLLLHKEEIRKIQAKISEKGLTLVPLKAFFNSKGLLKIELAIAKGKKLYDKRETIKARENQRQMEQIKKQY